MLSGKVGKAGTLGRNTVTLCQPNLYKEVTAGFQSAIIMTFISLQDLMLKPAGP